MRSVKLLIPAVLAAAIAFPAVSQATPVSPSSAYRWFGADAGRGIHVKRFKTVNASQPECSAAATPTTKRGRVTTQRGLGGSNGVGRPGRGKPKSAVPIPCVASSTPGANDGSPDAPPLPGLDPVEDIFPPPGNGDGNPFAAHDEPPAQGDDESFDPPAGDQDDNEEEGGTEPGEPESEAGPQSHSQEPPMGPPPGTPPAPLDPLEFLTDTGCIAGPDTSCDPDDQGTPPPPSFALIEVAEPEEGGPAPDTQFGPTTEQAANVPEPASLALIGLGLAGLGFQRRKRAARMAG